MKKLLLCLGMMISFLWISSMVAKSPDNQEETMIISTEMIMPKTMDTLGGTKKVSNKSRRRAKPAKRDTRGRANHSPMSRGKNTDLVSLNII